MKTTDLIQQAEQAMERFQNSILTLDLATAAYSHRLNHCRRLAGDARALLEEATEA